ncbi:myelin basic protein-like isoform X1 [Xyrauchen texanus]|uniref:myelin basic protein-like isoform X1 n=1 Tax=Xyrauchen texanus TaxID=154827 RepID=UPI002241D908|nr:myelin basic protein-like isoform X1 [Xyrauchen texanus]
MATASTSGQSAFGLGRKKRAPGLLDKIGRFFGGDKKRKGKGSFRGHLSSSPQRPQHSSTRRRGDVNPVVHFFRSFVSSPRPKSRASSSPRGTENIRSPHRRRREQNTLSRIFNLGESRSRSPPKRWSTIF